jgi:hypothetical protein
MSVNEESIHKDEVYLRHASVRRMSRVGMYACLCASGIISIIYPSILISAQVGVPTARVLSLALAIGGGVAIFGPITDRWIFEYSILPFLIISLAVYGSAAVISAFDQDQYPILAYGLTLIAFSFGLFARRKDVKAIERVRRAEVGYQQNARA